MKIGTMSGAEFAKAAYRKNGELNGNGPKCATCGDLAAWGTHPACARRAGKLAVWIDETKIESSQRR